MSIFTCDLTVARKLTNFINSNKKKKNYKRAKLSIDFDLLNSDQRKALSVVEKAVNEQLTIKSLIHGFAGSGKSYLIHSIRRLISERISPSAVLVAGFSGVAACNVDARMREEYRVLDDMTSRRKLHSLSYIKRQNEMVASTLHPVKFLIIDECSMISLQMLGYIESKMRLLMENGGEFAGRSVILCGDLGQLGPVKGTALYECPREDDKLAQHGQLIYHKFDTIIFLDQCMRFMGPETERFQLLLLNVRNGKVTEEDVSLLNTRLWRKLSDEEKDTFKSATYVYPNNREVDRFNRREIDKLPQKVCMKEIQRIDGGGEMEIDLGILAVGARVMLIKNLWVENKLVNGSCGVIDSIAYYETKPEPALPAYVNVVFDNYKGPFPPGQSSLPVPPSSLYGDQDRKKVIPLRNNFASTIHKSQSLTIEKVVVDFRGGDRACASCFVALSRARNLQDIALLHTVHMEDFVAGPKVEQMLKEEARLRSLAL